MLIQTVIRLLHPVSHDDLPDVRGPHAETSHKDVTT